jgi:Polyketide cyclase / dehydrase and lipid transport
VTRRHLTGRFTVPLPPDEAFRLFTPRGEEAWSEGWRPVFPDPTDDDCAPGTVFETGGHGAVTTWVVTERDPGRRLRYALIAPHERAGTVTVVLADAAAGSDVTISYDLTALSPGAEPGLDRFAAGYPDFLRSWQNAIGRALGRAERRA